MAVKVIKATKQISGMTTGTARTTVEKLKEIGRAHV